MVHVDSIFISGPVYSAVFQELPLARNKLMVHVDSIFLSGPVLIFYCVSGESLLARS